jgi:hypothetical protein
MGVKPINKKKNQCLNLGLNVCSQDVFVLFTCELQERIVLYKKNLQHRINFQSICLLHNHIQYSNHLVPKLGMKCSLPSNRVYGFQLTHLTMLCWNGFSKVQQIWSRQEKEKDVSYPAQGEDEKDSESRRRRDPDASGALLFETHPANDAPRKNEAGINEWIARQHHHHHVKMLAPSVGQMTYKIILKE